MKLKLITTTVIVLAIGLSTTEAQPGLRTQRHRIEQGVRSKELTRTEARNLSIQQRNIHRNIRRAKADGIITRRERKVIRMDQRHHNRSIYRMKHNQRNRI
jgi:hypothetical protein